MASSFLLLQIPLLSLIREHLTTSRQASNEEYPTFGRPVYVYDLNHTFSFGELFKSLHVYIILDVFLVNIRCSKKQCSSSNLVVLVDEKGGLFSKLTQKQNSQGEQMMFLRIITG